MFGNDRKDKTVNNRKEMKVKRKSKIKTIVVGK